MSRHIQFALLFSFVVAVAGAQTPSAGSDPESKRDGEYLAYLTRSTPGYTETLARQRIRMRELHQAVAQREARGQDTACSHQILAELDWLTDDTMDFSRIVSRTKDIDSVLAHPEEEARAREQDSADGGWGRCHSEWFFTVTATYDHLAKLSSRDERPRYRLRLLDRVNSPGKLRQYFASVAVSDIARTGHDNLRELNESLENLSRLILRGHPAYYPWDPKLKDAMTDVILNRLRDRATGWWGARYIHDGETQFVDSLSMTFHMVTSLSGNVPDLGKIMDHLLAVKDLDYPVGWLKRGGYSNHHEMDVIALFGYGWPHMSETQRRAAAIEIRKVVRWCLDKSLQADGSFASDGKGDSLEEETDFGISLLARAGVFDKSKRFWTTEDFPEAEAVLEKLTRFVRKQMASGGAGGSYYEGALEDLGALPVKP